MEITHLLATCNLPNMYVQINMLVLLWLLWVKVNKAADAV